MANAKLDFVWARGTGGTYCARITGGSVSVNATHYFKVSFDPACGAGTKLQLYMGNVLIGQADPCAPSSSNPSSAISIVRYVVGNSLFSLATSTNYASLRASHCPAAPSHRRHSQTAEHCGSVLKLL
ncbi:hypothetical protein [Dyella sp. 2RAB6]|uniref:hypothetical protein n=1 Tax=Dyella sp. 2RAB6 TaxID=3232992 RepID=UPI003F8F0D2C